MVIFLFNLFRSSMDARRDLYLKYRYYNIPSNRTCTVIGCDNTGWELKCWLKEECEEHKCCRSSFHCSCEPPYLLFPLPAINKDPNGRKEWIRLLKQNAESYGQEWEPSTLTRVCSDHFVDGLPSAENPSPTINMGQELSQEPIKEEFPSGIDLPEHEKPKAKRITIEGELWIITNGELSLIPFQSAVFFSVILCTVRVWGSMVICSSNAFILSISHCWKQSNHGTCIIHEEFVSELLKYIAVT